MSCGSRHTAFVTADGNVYACGDSTHGQCALTHDGVTVTPTRINFDGTMQHGDKVAVRSNSMCLMRSHSVNASSESEDDDAGTGEQIHKSPVMNASSKSEDDAAGTGERIHILYLG